MAQPRENPFNPSSPRSSTGGADSFKGTPEARLTAFSPDERLGKSTKLIKTFARSASATSPVKLPSYSHRDTASQIDKDPFISPSHGTRLSPTASAFKPVINLVGFSLPRDGQPVSNELSSEIGISHYLEVSSANSLSIAEVDDCLMVRRDMSILSTPSHFFDTPLICTKNLVEKGARLQGTRQLESIEGHIQIHFSDLRDACSVVSGIQLAKQYWEVSYLDPCQVLKVCNP
jgi:hypothetical protein